MPGPHNLAKSNRGSNSVPVISRQNATALKEAVDPASAGIHSAVML